MYNEMIKEIEEEIQFVKDGGSSPQYIAGMERALELIKMQM